jgi:NAD(P)-dependent dehydrogenase (short-subunit alcohol dehydrogenase family)
MTSWTIADIPTQAGKLAVVTGATGGLGYQTAMRLAQAGAEVVLTGRNDAKGREAISKIRNRFPDAKISFEALDLANLASVADFGRRFADAHSSLDLLINNAGVMALPTRRTTADGFEMQFGTNYLGHYALTARLLALLRSARRPRVVNLSSIAHRTGFIQFSDLQGERLYSPWKAYNQSKLAMLMFALELQRRSGLEFDEQRFASGMGAHRSVCERTRLRTALVCQPVCGAAVQSIRRRRCVADLVRRDLSASRRRRILWTERSWRIEGSAGPGPDHAASQGQGRREQALGCVTTTDGRIV